MIIRKFGGLVSFQTPEGMAMFAEGDFSLTLTPEDIRGLTVNEGVKGVHDELLGYSTACRSEQDNLVLYFHQGTRWDPVFRAGAKYHQDLKVSQFLVLTQVILRKTFRLEGRLAYAAICRLFELTPGSKEERAAPFPKPKDENQLARIGLVKFIDTEHGNKPSVHFIIPAGTMTARIIGTQAANIKALGTIFAGEANVHFWVRSFPVEVDLEEVGDRVLATV